MASAASATYKFYRANLLENLAFASKRARRNDDPTARNIRHQEARRAMMARQGLYDGATGPWGFANRAHPATAS